MVAAIFGFVCIALGLTALALQRFYSSVPAKELKRLAAQGDHLAKELYRPVSYGASLRTLLWLVFCLGVSGGLLLIVRALPLGFAFVVAVVVLGAGILVQSLRLTVQSANFAMLAAPAMNWLLYYTHVPLDLLARALNQFRHHTAHSGLYEKEDLLDLLEQQKEQPDNRISHHDLELLARAAQFDDRQAADIVVPMSRARLVNVEDTVGPILLGELHDSGQNSFLVYDETPDKVVGTLFLRDAVAAREGGRVRDLMHSRLCFVHEDFSLRRVLQAFARTGQFMVVVVNSFEEPVGVITLRHLLTQLVGEQSDDDFDAFEDRSAVAAFKTSEPAEDELAPTSAEDTEEADAPSPEPTEVVE